MTGKQSIDVWWWIAAGIVIAILIFPKSIWIPLILLGVLAWLLHSALKNKRSKDPIKPYFNSEAKVPPGPTLAELMERMQPPSEPMFSRQSSVSTHSPSQLSPLPTDEDFYSVGLEEPPSSERSFTIPRVPDDFGEARWVSPTETITVADTLLPGGMFYVGARLNANTADFEPSLISPQLNIARHGNFRERQTEYWPNFASITAAARRSYLNWLADGRSHPDCDIGFVFLFFYGLERRVLLDATRNPSLKAEWPSIAAELRRLLGIYGHRSGSFSRYAGELLSWIELDGAPAKLYLEPVPKFPKTYELPPYIRLALGLTSVDRVPIPANLALAWVRLNPGSNLRTPATRCPEEFDQLFKTRYHDKLGSGLVLPKNRTRLKFAYRPASAGFHGTSIGLNFGDVPDVTALTAPIRTLMEIAHECTDELAAFSRALGKDPTAGKSLDGLLQLPAILWPAEAQSRIEGIKASMIDGSVTLSLDEVISALGGASQTLGREKIRGLAKTLEAAGIGFEPDVLAGARTPAAHDPVVLFALSPTDAKSSDNSIYKSAALTLQLASAVAEADGDFSDREVAHLRQEIDQWNHLTSHSRVRLHAHLSLLVAAPMTLAAVRKKLEPLEHQAREAVATFMATLAQSDGIVSPAEVKFLEKVYKALGVEPKRVFADIHSIGAGAPGQASTQTTGFRLDPTRIAELEKDTARVSALLSEIFTEEEPAVTAVSTVEEETAAQTGLMGLDEAHTALVRLLLSRPQWSRQELEDAAADLELMLDGALEQINEAALDTYEDALIDGDDPIDINANIVERIEQ